MSQYRYILDKSSKKYICPSCQKKRFVRYIDTENQELLPSEYGCCDRQDNCTYHLSPYKDGYSKMITEQEKGFDTNFQSIQRNSPKKSYQIPKTVFFPKNVFKETLKGYENNTFIQNLLTSIPYPFTSDIIEKIVSMYYLGTISNGYRKNAISFPFIDINENIRTIQVKQFDEDNHTISTDFLHSIIERFHRSKNKEIPSWLKTYQTNDKKVSCLFGEHLLNKYKDNPIALVEAPKTAIYGNLYFGLPTENSSNFLWLAVYNLSSLNITKCHVLTCRKVFLFPDLSKNGNAFKLWSNKAKQLSKEIPNTEFIVSDLLEKELNPTEEERKKGLDLGDYLIQLNWRVFQDKDVMYQHIEEESTIPLVNTSAEKKTNLWDISEIETFFNNINIPEKITIKGITIKNVTQYISKHLEYVKANNGKKVFSPYWNRLVELKNELSN